jgi:phenylacetate-CoA ligase
LLNYATKNSEYYRSLGIKQSESPYEWIKNFPILTKQILREKSDQLLTKERKKLKMLSSSGSSGFQSTVYLNNQELSLFWANQVNWWEWAGYQVGDSMIQMGINTERGLIRGLKDKLFKVNYINSFSLSEGEILEVLRYARDRNIKFLCGYSSSLNLFSEIARKHNIADFQMKGVISLGEKMVDAYRENVKDVFSCPVYETYGSGEGLLVASQKDLKSLYINTPHVYLELLDDNGNEVPDGEIGHVVVTSLIHYSMPLIRYKIGDMAVKLPEKEYPENRALDMPLLKEVIGREADVLKTPRGNYLSVHSFTGLFAKYPQIRQFKVIRKSYDKLQIDFVPDNNFQSEDLSYLKKWIEEEITNEFNIAFNKVHFIKPSKSGKPQIIEDLC